MSPTTALPTQTVTIVGPNLRDQSKGTFHVHAAGCADLTRNRNLRGEQTMTINASSLEGIAANVYEDIIAENDGNTGADYLGEFHFAPCVTLPAAEPEQAEPTEAELLKARRRRALVERPLRKLTDDELAAIMRLGDSASIFDERVSAAIYDLAELAVTEDTEREGERDRAARS